MVPMSKPSSNMAASNDSSKVEPDNFAFYTCEVKRLLSQNEEFLPFATESTGNTSAKGEACGKINSEPSGSVFSKSVGSGLSDHKKESLNSLLRQSLAVLTPEADGMLEPVLCMRKLHSQIRKEKMGATSENETGENNKRIKLSSSSSTSFSKHESPVSSESCREADGDLQVILENDDTKWLEGVIKKYSNQLFATLDHMEEQLEELLDTVVSTCRPMALVEKRHLQKLIQNLPAKNLNRVADIVQHRKPEAKSGEEIFVDLEREDNTTLWRLYYYIEAFKKAKKLSA